ncbi:hypothetical protein EFK50_07665 [Nocardioides marmoriginsengisoli]|uniref:Uncharacterized protein n=1 Tax=Nocardioides marmoriginsengisoli TaxID=661483 RepID=A0A3N0CLS7_9ACTN|nr:hypothetical protein [Nocardioides marmoriginsengisoli]RNL64392.1 hypothetical protein EFK50_07665 [Nocardioides marmoriginsengisoli]
MSGFKASDPLGTALHLTDADRAAWGEYESASRKAALEYEARPSAKPKMANHASCLCCGILTTRFVCLSCQQRDAEWRAIATDRDALIAIRRADIFPLRI